MYADVHGTIIADPQNIEAFAAALSQWRHRLEDTDKAKMIRHACAARGAASSIEKNVEATICIIEQVLHLTS